jgi:hypothetical protein
MVFLYPKFLYFLFSFSEGIIMMVHVAKGVSENLSGGVSGGVSVSVC